MNKKEKIRAYELNDMASKIIPLTGLGARTQTTIDIGKSWIDHAPLLEHLKTAIYANSMLSGIDKSQETIDYYSEKYNDSVEYFYEYLGETFRGEPKKRPVIDWL